MHRRVSVNSADKPQATTKRSFNVTTNAEEALPLQPKGHDEDNKTEVFDQEAALPHFQVLIDFVHKYLAKQIQLYERLRQGKEKYISFENLWMLFDTGDTIVCPSRSPTETRRVHVPVAKKYTTQAYRVVASSRGMPKTRKFGPENFAAAVKSSPAHPKSFMSMTYGYTSLCVYCYYIDYNGVEFGVVSEALEFKPFEGQAEIRSLLAYPACYELDVQLYDRGKVFLDAISISYMQHEGLTVGPGRQEVRSMRYHPHNQFNLSHMATLD